MTDSKETADDLTAQAFKLSCDDQFKLATMVAANVGYVLIGDSCSGAAPAPNEPSLRNPNFVHMNMLRGAVASERDALVKALTAATCPMDGKAIFCRTHATGPALSWENRSERRTSDHGSPRGHPDRLYLPAGRLPVSTDGAREGDRRCDHVVRDRTQQRNHRARQEQGETMLGQLTMTKDQMRAGLAAGRRLTQDGGAA